MFFIIALNKHNSYLLIWATTNENSSKLSLFFFYIIIRKLKTMNERSAKRGIKGYQPQARSKTPRETEKRQGKVQATLTQNTVKKKTKKQHLNSN